MTNTTQAVAVVTAAVTAAAALSFLGQARAAADPLDVGFAVVFVVQTALLAALAATARDRSEEALALRVLTGRATLLAWMAMVALCSAVAALAAWRASDASPAVAVGLGGVAVALAVVAVATPTVARRWVRAIRG